MSKAADVEARAAHFVMRRSEPEWREEDEREFDAMARRIDGSQGGVLATGTWLGPSRSDRGAARKV